MRLPESSKGFGAVDGDPDKAPKPVPENGWTWPLAYFEERSVRPSSSLRGTGWRSRAQASLAFSTCVGRRAIRNAKRGIEAVRAPFYSFARLSDDAIDSSSNS